MRRLIWSEHASIDLFAIADSHAEIDFGLPDMLLDRVIVAPRPLLERPALGVRELRKWPVKRPPFLLLYRLIGSSLLEITRIRHVREDWWSE